jgi:hypothetical protein
MLLRVEGHLRALYHDGAILPPPCATCSERADRALGNQARDWRGPDPRVGRGCSPGERGLGGGPDRDALPGLSFPLPGLVFPTGRQMADYLEAHTAQHRLPVRTGERVTRLRPAGGGGDGFEITCGASRTGRAT